MIDLTQIARHKMQTEPYAWAEVGNLFSPEDGAALAASFPCGHFKTLMSYGGEKDYEYEARALVSMGAHTISHPRELSEAWLSLACDLLSPDYRSAMSLQTGCDLTTVPMEVNVFHYGPRACLGPHPDLPDKIVTHVLYFNTSWDREDGGCLSILRSPDPTDVAAEIPPIVGNSVVVVRSENSWHAVSRVVKRLPRLSAQLDRDVLSSRLRQHDVATRRHDAAALVRRQRPRRQDPAPDESMGTHAASTRVVEASDSQEAQPKPAAAPKRCDSNQETHGPRKKQSRRHTR